MENADEIIKNRLKLIIDKLASGKEFITSKDIIAEYENISLDKIAYSKLPSYNSLKQVQRELNKEECLEYDKTKTPYKFRYKKEHRYHYAQIEEEKKKKKLENDNQIIFFTEGLEMLLDEYTKFNPIIKLESIAELRNIDLLKNLIKYIKNKWVVTFDYNQAYSNVERITISPHFLKEYNSRWFLFGSVHEKDGDAIINCSVDRIITKENQTFIVNRDIEYVGPSRDFYEEYFKNIVGVTKKRESVLQTITIKTLDFKVHNLIETKPIHPSQKMLKNFDEDENEGLFTIEVFPNIELRTRLLSYGPGICLIGDSPFEENFRKCVIKMASYYHSSSI